MTSTGAPLTDGLRAYIGGFDFTIFGWAHIDEVLEDLKTTAHYAARFGGQLPAPPRAIVPKEPEAHESKYIGHLLDVYSEELGVPLGVTFCPGDEARVFVGNYGHLIGDECHHLSAVSFELVAHADWQVFDMTHKGQIRHRIVGPILPQRRSPARMATTPSSSCNAGRSDTGSMPRRKRPRAPLRTKSNCGRRGFRRRQSKKPVIHSR